MKTYKIKSNTFNTYLMGVGLSVNQDGEPCIEPYYSRTRERVALYEESKAKVYVEELNKEYPDADFVMEEYDNSGEDILKAAFSDQFLSKVSIPIDEIEDNTDLEEMPNYLSLYKVYKLTLSRLEQLINNNVKIDSSELRQLYNDILEVLDEENM